MITRGQSLLPLSPRDRNAPVNAKGIFKLSVLSPGSEPIQFKPQAR